MDRTRVGVSKKSDETHACGAQVEVYHGYGYSEEEYQLVNDRWRISRLALTASTAHSPRNRLRASRWCAGAATAYSGAAYWSYLKLAVHELLE